MPDWMEQLVAEAPRLILSAGTLTLFVTSFAYLSHPRAKAFVLALPIPFTCAYLSSGTMLGDEYQLPKIDTTHFFGLIVMVIYHWSVYWTRIRWRWPLAASITAGIVWFVGVAAATRPWISDVVHPMVMGGALVGVWVVFVSLYRGTMEASYRSITPWWIKAPGVFLIGLCMFNATALLGGAVTTFPYAGVFASYELRHSLRTLAGQLSINTIGLTIMMLTIWMLQDRFEPNALWPLVIGWGTTLSAVALVYGKGLGRPRDTDDYSV